MTWRSFFVPGVFFPPFHCKPRYHFQHSGIIRTQKPESGRSICWEFGVDARLYLPRYMSNGKSQENIVRAAHIRKH